MNIREFKAGQTAYIYAGKRGKENEFIVMPCTIKSVGRVYVTTDERWGNQYKAADWFPDGLVKKEDWGDGRYLFPAREAIDQYLDKIEVLAWFRENFYDWSKIKQYSAEALAAAKEALMAGKQ